jgi:hypothetical protein
MALCLLPSQTLALEGSPGLDKGDPFLPELLFRRGKGGSLVRQIGPQLLGLLSLLLGLALPSPCSLEGRTILLELGTSRAHLGLPLRHQGPRPCQILPRLLQRLVPIHGHCLHLLDCGGILCSPGV